MADVVADASESAAPEPRTAEPAAIPEQRSTMLERFGLFGRLGMRFVFRFVRVRSDAVTHLRTLANQGTLIYVMRYRSALDYLLVNAVLLREGLPLARFAPGVSTVWFRPWREALRWAFRRRGGDGNASHSTCNSLVAAGQPVLLFMRSHSVAGRRRRALAAARIGQHYLRDVIRAAQAFDRTVFFVPVAIFRGKGFRRRESRFATLLYSVQEAPGEIGRLILKPLGKERQARLRRGEGPHRRGGSQRSRNRR